MESNLHTMLPVEDRVADTKYPVHDEHTVARSLVVLAGGMS